MTLAKKLLEANRDRPVRSTTGRPNQRLYVYGRAPRPCLRCGTSVRRADRTDSGHANGSHQRPTYWCPTCQTGPTNLTPPGDLTKPTNPASTAKPPPPPAG